MAQVIEIESRERDVIEIGIRSVDVIEIGYRGGGVPWGNITGNIRLQTDLIELIEEFVQPSDDKEIVNVLSYGGTIPSNPEDGDRWIDPENKLIYVYSESDGWGTDEPSKDVIYITADTSHIYHYDGTQFVDVTGQNIDNTIYVSSIDDSALEAYTEKGLYNVCVGRAGLASAFFALAVTIVRGPRRIGQPASIRYTQTLYNMDGYYKRTKINTGNWSEWDRFEYASQDQVETQIQAAKDELLPLIYAGL